MVFLDAPREGGARAGEVCARHARTLAPPRGWCIIDRREHDTAAQDAPAQRGVALAPEPVAAPTPWHPRFERGDTLGGVLDASTPLLSRAFRNVRAG